MIFQVSSPRSNEGLTMNEVGPASGTPVGPPVQPPLTCRLRPKEVISRQGLVLNMGEVELENHSAAPVEIEYTMTPLQFLELVVIGPDGEVVSEGHFSDRFSPSHQRTVLRLMPGEKFTSNVPLLATMPHEKRVPGTYMVQVSYRFQGTRVRAEPVIVNCGAAPDSTGTEFGGIDETSPCGR
jgi:hypothetical protein